MNDETKKMLLNSIGLKIQIVFNAINSIEKEEVELFDEYVRELDNAMPFLDPTAYRKESDNIDMAKNRLEIIKKVVEDKKSYYIEIKK